MAPRPRAPRVPSSRGRRLPVKAARSPRPGPQPRPPAWDPSRQPIPRPLPTPTPPWYDALVFTPPRFPHELNLADYFLFDRLNEGLGDKVAILFGDRRQTYAEVADRVRSLRAFLTMTGLAREERVLIALHDTPAFVWAFFATLYHGA